MSDPRPQLTELLAESPTEQPASRVDYDEDRLVVTVEGRSGPRVPGSVIVGVALFGAAAFICPGIFLVAAILLPIAIIATIGLLVFAPELLKRPLDTQKLIVAPDELSMVEVCPRRFQSGDVDEQDRTVTTLSRPDVRAPRLVTEDEDAPTGGIRLTDGDDELIFATVLLSGSGKAPDEHRHRELQWLCDVLTAALEKPTPN